MIGLLCIWWICVTLGEIPALAQQVFQVQDALIRGHELINQGRYSEAITILQDVVRRDPTQDAAYHNLGFAYLRAGQYTEAMAAFQAAIQLDPRYAPSHYGLGLTFWAQHNDTQAIAAFRLPSACNLSMLPRITTLVWLTIAPAVTVRPWQPSSNI
jgi:tetratricopeptide (TPR) repeat protein